MLAERCTSCLLRRSHGRRLCIACLHSPVRDTWAEKFWKCWLKAFALFSEPARAVMLTAEDAPLCTPTTASTCVDSVLPHALFLLLQRSHESMRLLCAAIFIATASCTSPTAFTCADSTDLGAASLLLAVIKKNIMKLRL